ncbi:MAG: hypothetical protein ABIH42_08085, partial [Planctomycetota bacterium]
EIEYIFRQDLIISKIAEKENIFVTEEEIDAEIVAISREKSVSEVQILEQLEAQDLMGKLRFDMLTGKVKAFLREKGNIKILPKGTLQKRAEEKAKEIAKKNEIEKEEVKNESEQPKEE